MVGCTAFTTGSSESSHTESNLALPHLYLDPKVSTFIPIDNFFRCLQANSDEVEDYFFKLKITM